MRKNRKKIRDNRTIHIRRGELYLNKKCVRNLLIIKQTKNFISCGNSTPKSVPVHWVIGFMGVSDHLVASNVGRVAGDFEARQAHSERTKDLNLVLIIQFETFFFDIGFR